MDEMNIEQREAVILCLNSLADSMAASDDIKYIGHMDIRGIAQVQEQVLKLQKEDEKKPSYKFNEELFERFWKAYARPVGKKKTIEYWKKKKIDDVLAENIILAAGVYAERTETKYQKHPERWIRDEHWEDEIIKTKEQSSVYTPNFNPA